jgi:phosphoglycerate dehydrogenase-like enzyme
VRKLARVKIAILDDHQGVALGVAPWGDLGDDAEVVAFSDNVADDDALVARLEPFEVVVAMRERTPFDRARLKRLPNVKLLVTTGMRNASIDVAAARELGIVVSGTGGVSAATAELTWALILALARHVPAEDRGMRDGGWQSTVGIDLAGRTLGIAGLGNQGAPVARIGRAFGMRLIAWSQNLTPERAAEHGAEAVSRDELLAQSDVLSIHLKLSDRSRGLFAAQELARMKPTALLVNTSRGPIVDEGALVAALRDGTIGGAALDVYDTEPLPADHPLRSTPNTVLTPHIGYVTEATYEVFYGEAVEDIAAWRAGAPVRVLPA